MRIVYKETTYDRIIKELSRARDNFQHVERIYLTPDEMNEFKESGYSNWCATFDCGSIRYYIGSVEIMEEP